MEHKDFYRLSKWLRTILRRYRCDEVMGFHAYRYAIFCDSSPRGQYCKYAAASKKLYYADNEGGALATFLKELKPPVPDLNTFLELIDEN